MKISITTENVSASSKARGKHFLNTTTEKATWTTFHVITSTDIKRDVEQFNHICYTRFDCEKDQTDQSFSCRERTKRCESSNAQQCSPNVMLQWLKFKLISQKKKRAPNTDLCEFTSNSCMQSVSGTMISLLLPFSTQFSPFRLRKYEMNLKSNVVHFHPFIHYEHSRLFDLLLRMRKGGTVFLGKLNNSTQFSMAPYDFANKFLYHDESIIGNEHPIVYVWCHMLSEVWWLKTSEQPEIFVEQAVFFFFVKIQMKRGKFFGLREFMN